MLKFQIEKDNSGEYRWRLRVTNGKVIADGGEGYKNKGDCQLAIDLIRSDVAKAEVEDQTCPGGLPAPTHSPSPAAGVDSYGSPPAARELSP